MTQTNANPLYCAPIGNNPNAPTPARQEPALGVPTYGNVYIPPTAGTYPPIGHADAHAPFAPGNNLPPPAYAPPASQGAVPSAPPFYRGNWTPADMDRLLDTKAAEVRAAGITLCREGNDILSICDALEHFGWAAKTSPWQRSSLRKALSEHHEATVLSAFKHAHAQAFRATMEGVLSFYELDKHAFGLPTVEDVASQSPAVAYANVMACCPRIQRAVIGFERPDLAHMPDGQLPDLGVQYYTERNANNVVLCSAYAEFYNGPTDDTGMHHVIPLMMVEQHGAGWHDPQLAPYLVTPLAHTARERGYMPFVLDDNGWFVPKPAY